MNEPGNKYQPIPSNVGLTDESSTALINEYNRIALKRNELLHAASESSPTVTPLTAQLDDLTNSIKRAMRQAKLGMEIQRCSCRSVRRTQSLWLLQQTRVRLSMHHHL